MEKIQEAISTLNKDRVTIGIVGPARSGKSLFIRKFAEIIGNFKEEELPKVKEGRYITTNQMTFVPKKPKEILLSKDSMIELQFIECIGVKIPGSKGLIREHLKIEGIPTSLTPEKAVLFQTHMAMTELCNYGIVILTDGSFGEFKRFHYIDAESEILQLIDSLRKPYTVVFNTTRPNSNYVRETILNIEAEYRVPVLAMDLEKFTKDHFMGIIHALLNRKYIKEFNINLPKEVQELDAKHPKRVLYENSINGVLSRGRRFILDEVPEIIEDFKAIDFIENVELSMIDRKLGVIEINIHE